MKKLVLEIVKTPSPALSPSTRMHGIVIAASLDNDSGLGNFALSVLPLVLFILIFYFFFRRKIAALQAKLSAASINNPEGGPHRHHSLARAYFRAIGFFAGNFLGRFRHYDKRHMAFLSSGYVCQQCGETLLNRSWMPLVRCLDSDGNPMPLMEASKKGAEFECANCHFRWPIRNKA